MDTVNWALTWLLTGGGVTILGQILKLGILKGWKARALIWALCVASAVAGMAVRGELPMLGWSWGDIPGSLGRLGVATLPVLLIAQGIYRTFEDRYKNGTERVKRVTGKVTTYVGNLIGRLFRRGDGS